MYTMNIQQGSSVVSFTGSDLDSMLAIIDTLKETRVPLNTWIVVHDNAEQKTVNTTYIPVRQLP